MCAGVFCSGNFSFGSSLAETWTDDDSCHSRQFFSYIVARDVFAVDENGVHFAVVIGAGMGEALEYAFVSILQVVFPDKSDI